MPIPTPTGGVVVARPRRESRTSLRKRAREAQAAARAAVDAAVDAALRRRPRVERLAEALATPLFDHERLAGDLLQYRFALMELRRLPTDTWRAAAAFAVDVERRAPGLILGRACEFRIGLGVIRLASFSSSFARPLSSWRPPRRRPAKVWRSLVAHLVDRYPMAAPLDLLLLDTDRPEALASTYVDVAGGRSWRALGLPTVVNRAVAHALSTPSSAVTTAMGLVRDAQARAVGLSLPHRQVVRERHALQRFLDDEEGLFAALSFLAQHPEMSVADVATVVDGLASVEGDLPSMKGRTPRSLLAVCREARVAREARQNGRVDVGPLPVPPFTGGRYEIVNDPHFGTPTFVVEPLRTGLELVNEGLAMRHCVGTYAEKAKGGHVVIVGVRRCLSSGEEKRAVTVEVQPARAAVAQVRGRTNRRATDVEEAVVRCWAQEHGLAIDAAAF